MVALLVGEDRCLDADCNRILEFFLYQYNEYTDACSQAFLLPYLPEHSRYRSCLPVCISNSQIRIYYKTTMTTILVFPEVERCNGGTSIRLPWRRNHVSTSWGFYSDQGSERLALVSLVILSVL